MKFRLVAHWPSPDILPSIEEHLTATLAIRRYRQLMRTGMSSVSIFVRHEGVLVRLSPTGLLKHSRAESASPAGSRLAQIRKSVASALVAMLASALPNSFGDFGVVSTWGTLRAARGSQSGRRRYTTPI